jgi:hypothetical protein
MDVIRFLISFFSSGILKLLIEALLGIIHEQKSKNNEKKKRYVI